MSVQIIDVRMADSGGGHEAISHHQWKDSDNGSSNWADKAAMVDWVWRNPNQVRVGEPVMSAWVEVVENPGGVPYLRTRADGLLSDNLLSLPGAR